MVDYGHTTNKCPICKKATVEAFRPFCSKRCANADLLNWLKGKYAVPGGAALPEEEFDPSEYFPSGNKAH